MGLLSEMVQQDSQFVLPPFSLLMAYPMPSTATPFTPGHCLDDVDSVRLTRDFLNNPDRFSATCSRGSSPAGPKVR